MTNFSNFTTYSNIELFGDNKSNLFVIGYDKINNTEFKYGISNFFPTVNSLGGASVYKNITSNTQINLRGITAASNKITIAENTNDVSIDVNESNLNVNNISGTLSLSKGGTGQSLSDPGGDRILFWDDSEGKVDWLNTSQLNSGLSITGTALSVVERLTTISNKGDLITINGSGEEIAFSLGTDSQFLTVNTATASGLQWKNLSDFAIHQTVYNLGFLGVSGSTGYLRIGNGLSWTNNTSYQTIAVNEATIDLNNCDNSNANVIKNYVLNQNLDLQTNGLISSTDHVWKFGDDDTVYGAITPDTILTVEINGVTYKIAAEAI